MFRVKGPPWFAALEDAGHRDIHLHVHAVASQEERPRPAGLAPERVHHIGQRENFDIPTVHREERIANPDGSDDGGCAAVGHADDLVSR